MIPGSLAWPTGWRADSRPGRTRAVGHARGGCLLALLHGAAAGGAGARPGGACSQRAQLAGGLQLRPVLTELWADMPSQRLRRRQATGAAKRQAVVQKSGRMGAHHRERRRYGWALRHSGRSAARKLRGRPPAQMRRSGRAVRQRVARGTGPDQGAGRLARCLQGAPSAVSDLWPVRAFLILSEMPLHGPQSQAGALQAGPWGPEHGSMPPAACGHADAGSPGGGTGRDAHACGLIWCAEMARIAASCPSAPCWGQHTLTSPPGPARSLCCLPGRVAGQISHSRSSHPSHPPGQLQRRLRAAAGLMSRI